MPEPTLLATHLRAIIAIDGRSMYAISKAAGLRPQILESIMRGESRHPTWPHVVALARALHVSVAVLAGEP